MMAKQKDKDDQVKLIVYNQALKDKLANHQQNKYQELQDKMNQARQEQVRGVERERNKKKHYEQQRKHINDYKEQKHNTDQLLNHNAGHNKFYSSGDNGLMMFYERQQNFGFPTTSTTTGGVMTTITSDNKKNSIEGLTRLNAEIKTGHVQLEDTTFGEKDDGFETNRKKDSLDLVGDV